MLGNCLKVLFFVTCLAGVATTMASELLVSNYFGNNVARYDLKTRRFMGTFSGGSLKGVLATRIGPDGLLYVCSESNNTIQRFSLASFRYVDTILSGRGLNHPTGIAFGSSGTMIVGNFEDSSVTAFGPNGGFLNTLVASGADGLKGCDVGIVIGPDGKLYVPGFDSNSILRFDPATGSFIDTFIPAGKGGLSQPRTILFRDNKVWVTSDNGNKVLRYGLDGSFIDEFVASGAGGLKGATGMVFGGDGFLYISSWRNNKVLRFNAKTGAFVDVFIDSLLSGPTFLTIAP